VSEALPDGFGIVLDRAASLSSQRRTILGRSPRRLLRLSPAAIQRLRSWIAGEPIAGWLATRLRGHRSISARWPAAWRRRPGFPTSWPLRWRSGGRPPAAVSPTRWPWARTSIWSGRCMPRAGEFATSQPHRVAHEHRTMFAAWLRRRFEYGLSAAPLAQRHPRSVAPVVLPLWSAAAWTLVMAARPRAGLAVIAVTGFVCVAGSPGSPLWRGGDPRRGQRHSRLWCPARRGGHPRVASCGRHRRPASAGGAEMATRRLVAAERRRVVAPAPRARSRSLRAGALARRRRLLLRRLGRVRARTRSRPADPAVKRARIRE
jgi:hypothetical protein